MNPAINKLRIRSSYFNDGLLIQAVNFHPELDLMLNVL